MTLINVTVTRDVCTGGLRIYTAGSWLFVCLTGLHLVSMSAVKLQQHCHSDDCETG
jgi:hypothetical protein